METTSKIGQHYQTFRQAVRPVETHRKKTKMRTAGNDRPAFLNQKFLPLLANEHPEILRDSTIETDFKVSMENLCKLYGWEVLDLETIGYPINLSVAMQSALKRLGTTDTNLQLRFIKEGGRPARLSTTKTFSTGTCLFYIPIEPMYQMVLDDEKKETGNLLLSIYSYLYRIVEIPHFCDNYSYLGNIYAMLEEWWVNDEEYCDDREETEYVRAHFGRLNDFGINSLLMLQDGQHLEMFEKRIRDFRAKSKAQKELKILAEKFISLYRAYPERSIFDNMEAPKDIDEYDSYVRLEQLVHFFWNSTEPIHDQFMDVVNAELNECGVLEEAVSVQYFDEPQSAIIHDLAFEEKLIDLLHELCDNIKDLSHE